MSAKISVIIPVHNTAKYLDRCMESVLGQTFGDIEVILAENLSTDGSADMCDDYARRDSRVRVLHLDRAGLSHARNEALLVAESDAVCFIDSDDYVDKEMLEQLYSQMVLYGADIVGYNLAQEKDGITQIAPGDDDGSVITFDKAQLVTAFLLNVDNWSYTSACTKLFRKSLFDDLKFPEGRFHEDHAVMHLIAEKCSKAVWLQRAFYHYVYHGESITHTPTPQKLYDFFCADYARYCFIEEHRPMLISDYATLVNIYAVRCFKHFRIFMRNRKSDKFPAYKLEMIASLSSMARNNSIKVKILRRLKIIKNAYFLFYLIHVSFRRR